MIEPRTLVSVLRQQLKTLEDDIRDQLGEQPELDAELRADWQAARDSGRVAAAYPQWRDEEITQAAVHWVLACVFLRVIEDQRLVDRPWLSGATPALRELAQDRHEQYFRQHPLHSDRDYLLHCFEDAASLPALGGLFDRAHNPLWRIRPSGDGAMALLGLWRAVDPDRGRCGSISAWVPAWVPAWANPVRWVWSRARAMAPSLRGASRLKPLRQPVGWADDRRPNSPRREHRTGPGKARAMALSLRGASRLKPLPRAEGRATGRAYSAISTRTSRSPSARNTHCSRPPSSSRNSSSIARSHPPSVNSAISGSA